MTKWEYLEIKIGNDSRLSIMALFENGKNITKSKTKEGLKLWWSSLEACPNYYGKRGWELFKMGKDGEIKWFLFKRELN